MPALCLRLFEALLLFTLCTTILAYNTNHKLAKHDDQTSIFISESLFNFVKNRTRNADKNKKQANNNQVMPQIMRKAYNPTRFELHGKKNISEIERTIQETFILDQRPGIVRFNASADYMYGDEPLVRTSQVNTEIQQKFKVHRGPDGKLNVVFNDLSSLQTNAPPHSYRTPLSDTFVYPTPEPTFALNNIKCNDDEESTKVFCTQVNNYPELTGLRSLLTQEYSSFFGNDLSSLPEPGDITTRIGNRMDLHEEYLCQSKQRIIYPQLGETSSSSQKLIVNTKDFPQGVRVEECVQTQSRCKYMDALMNNYFAECKQHYTYRLLASVNEEGNAVTKEQFKFPSCCKCVVRYKPN